MSYKINGKRLSAPAGPNDGTQNVNNTNTNSTAVNSSKRTNNGTPSSQKSTKRLHVLPQIGEARNDTKAAMLSAVGAALGGTFTAIVKEK